MKHLAVLTLILLSHGSLASNCKESISNTNREILKIEANGEERFKYMLGELSEISPQATGELIESMTTDETFKNLQAERIKSAANLIKITKSKNCEKILRAMLIMKSTIENQWSYTDKHIENLLRKFKYEGETHQRTESK